MKISDEEFITNTSKSAVSYISFGRASLDYIKATDLWMFQSQKTGRVKFTSPKTASKIVKAMRAVSNKPKVITVRRTPNDQARCNEKKGLKAAIQNT